MKSKRGSRATSIEFQARDGEALGGVFVESSEAVGAVLVAPATGVPSRFYLPFLLFLRDRGFSSLVFDYRGVGASRHCDAKASSARKQDWGELDMPAALEALSSRAPGLPLTLVGHSAGGQLMGLMDNVASLERIVQVSASSGYIGGMKLRTRLICWALLTIYIPLCCWIFGYAKTAVIGWGEDLPKRVALQWARWCRTKGYLESDFGASIATHHYEELRCPVLNLSAEDDPLATAENVEDLLRLMPNARVTRRRLRPSDYALEHIGHVGFFRRSHKALWGEIEEFLARSAGSSAGRDE